VRGKEPAFEDSLRLYEENFGNLKRYFAENADDPYTKFQIDHHIHQQCVEVLEARGKLPKGTLVKPALEFYRALYEKYDDAPEAEGWLRIINNDLVKYDILTADNPFAAFQVKVEELKQSLETELDENSRQKVSGLHQIAAEMDQRNEALRLLLTTVRAIYAASDNEELRDNVIGYDIQLDHLALEGIEFELEAVLLDGTPIDLKDYRGKVVVLDYWATWCGPCIGDMPMLKMFYENWHRDRGVELIGISVDDDLYALKAFVEKEQLAWPNASEKLSKEQNLPDSREKYNINAYPTTILIDQNGKVVRAGNGLYSILSEIWKLFPVEK
jgi:thiol-disulfide isomerase/thioredoxin